jgi:hypothetical protein
VYQNNFRFADKRGTGLGDGAVAMCAESERKAQFQPNISDSDIRVIAYCYRIACGGYRPSLKRHPE